MTQVEALLLIMDALRQSSPDSLAFRCGEVLDQAISGFGVGNETGLMIIGVGRVLLGSPVALGSGTVGLTNPVAMTCAAMGAIYYGWRSLSDKERKAVLQAVAAVLGVGPQLVQAIIQFTLECMQALFATMAEIKRILADIGAEIGLRLSQITFASRDRAYEQLRLATSATHGAVSRALDMLPSFSRTKD